MGILENASKNWLTVPFVVSVSIWTNDISVNQFSGQIYEHMESSLLLC